VLTQEITVESRPPESTGPPTRWQENHGNLLLAFVAIIFVIGGLLIAYRQTRFVPPQFPEADMIETLEVPAAAVEAANAVTINVIGAANDFGSMKLAIYDSESSFNKTSTALMLESALIVEGEATFIIPVERLPASIAVAAYHDENDDGELNRNRFGIPTERYGFSRNARALTGPPSFKQAVMNRPKPGEAIDLFIR
jgi:uncharacterized protein (DUF2141 family)